MITAIEQNLYIDPQRIPSGRCPVCGGAVYPEGYHCLRCERDKP